MLSQQARHLAIRPARSAASASIVFARALSTSAPKYQNDIPPSGPEHPADLLNSVFNQSKNLSSASTAQGPARSPSVNDTSFFTRGFQRRDETHHAADEQGPAKKSPSVSNILLNIFDESKKPQPSELPRPLDRGENSSWLAKSVLQQMRINPDQDLRLHPSTGRTVDVNNKTGLDAVRAIRMLEIKCAKNKVRVHQRDQRFHVRRSQKKKDLKMKRWRALFKKSFRQTLSRCAKMKSQGW
ncbi:hypothetical protein KEM56_007419 [Ascosphaera pollenicola]|nr:hypothetical protein KEM56_007419 [Ascosphaera pollenicola]